MKWFRYSPDPKKYERFATRDYDEYERLSFFNATPRAPTWAPFALTPDLGRRKKAPPASDFPYINTFAPIFSDRAWQALRPLIERDVEALPAVTPDGRPYHVIHLLRIVPNALDRGRAVFSLNPVTNTVTWVSRYVLRAAAVPAFHFFTLEEATGTSQLVSEQFRAAVAGAKLVGLKFLPVQTS